LLRVCWFILRWSTYNIPDSDVSEYLTTNTSNFDVGKYYVVCYNPFWVTPKIYFFLFQK